MKELGQRGKREGNQKKRQGKNERRRRGRFRGGKETTRTDSSGRVVLLLTQQNKHFLVRSPATEDQLRVAHAVPLVDGVYLHGKQAVFQRIRGREGRGGSAEGRGKRRRSASKRRPSRRHRRHRSGPRALAKGRAEEEPRRRRPGERCDGRFHVEEVGVSRYAEGREREGREERVSEESLTFFSRRASLRSEAPRARSTSACAIQK